MKRYQHVTGKAKAEERPQATPEATEAVLEAVCACPKSRYNGILYERHQPDCVRVGLFTQSAYTGRVERAAVSRSRFHRAGSE